MTEQNDLKLIRKEELCEMVGMPYRTIHKLISEGRFPKAVKISSRMVAWREQDIRDWINSLPEQRYGR